MERHAVDRAILHYSVMGGWSDVKDVGDRESRRYARCWADTIGIGGLSSAIYSYDLHAYCGSQEYFIEVRSPCPSGHR
ncbi:MAG: hypothetical protein QOE51_3900 [Actinoplanes sp.]|nr:hypothetical protein [Actinoplanes sp.]